MSLPKYPAYKDSGVAWLGEIPEHWNLNPIKTISTVNDDVLPESTPFDFELDYVDIGSVSLGSGIKKSENFTFKDAPSRARRLVKDGDVIVSTVRTYLKAIAPINNPSANMIVSTGFAVIRPKANVYVSSFAKFAMQSLNFVDEVISRSTGISYPAINATDLIRIRIPVPSPTEQNQIAQFLDRETAKIVDLILEQEKLITLLDEKRQAMISHAVTKGLNPNAPMKDSGVEWLGELPEHWATPPVYLRYSSELGKMLNTESITGNHLIPYLRNTDVQWGVINFENLPSMDIEPTYYNRYTVRNGDLLVCEGGEVGRTAIVSNVSGIIGYQKALHRLRAIAPDENPLFMFYTFCWAARYGVFNGEGQATIAHLTGEQLRKYRFPKPPLPEQNLIVSFLDKITTQLDNLKTEAQHGIDLLKERRSALISAAVTGKIDVRGLVNTEAA